MIKGVHHVGLTVSNLDQAIAWHKAWGGWSEELVFHIADEPSLRALLGVTNSKAKVVLLRNQTGFLELFEFAHPTASSAILPIVSDAGIRHICMQAPDGNALFDQAMSAGGSSHARPSGLGTGNLYSYIRDDDGNIVEIEGVPWASQLGASPWYAHVAFVSPDINRLAAFYAAFGQSHVHRSGNFGPQARFDRVAGIDDIVFDGQWINIGPTIIEIWQYHSPLTEAVASHDMAKRGWNHVCFETDDIENEIARISPLGFRQQGMIATAAFGRFAYGRDPDGNIVELLEFNAESKALSLENVTGKLLPIRLRSLAEKFYTAGGTVNSE